MTLPYIFKLATSPQEIAAYFALRHSIFAEEQGLFEDGDLDELDATSYPIVALLESTPSVLGVVRIYEPQLGLWYGGRLGVHRDYRRGGQIGRGLIYKAVTTAHSWGAQRFLATVQQQNVRFFQRLHWHSLEELVIRGCLHQLMEADLEHYPGGTEPIPQLPKATRC